MRAAVIKYLIDSGEWEAAYSGVGRFIRDVDPQGSSMAYDFSGSPIGPLAFEPSIEPTYQMPSTLDAMLYVYCNPAAPGPAYWGSTQYLVRFARPWLWPASSWLTLPVPGLAEPNVEMADSLNQLTLGSTAPAGLPIWGYSSAIITTPDRTSAASLADALAAAGWPPRAVSVQVLPSLLDRRMSFGLGSGASVFATGFRERAWANAEAKQPYIEYREPVLFLRANPGRSAPAAPFSTPERRSRGGVEGVDEHWLSPALEELRRAVVARAEEHGYRFVGTSTMEPNPIMNTSNCLDAFGAQPQFTCAQGSQDIAYASTPSLKGRGDSAASLAFGAMDVVIGAIHTRTGLAAYASVGFIDSNADTATLSGTARAWAPAAALPGVDQLFVLRVTDSCDADGWAPAPAHCLSHAMWGPGYMLVERAVLQPATRTGPAWRDLLPAAVLQFEAEAAHLGDAIGAALDGRPPSQ